MTDDATLSDFASAASDEAEGDSSTDTDGAPSADATAPSADADAPAADTQSSTAETRLSTYAWGTYACSRCDDETDRVWRSDGDLVCPDCKEW